MSSQGSRIESIRRFYEAFCAAFPGSRLVFEDIFGVGDQVVIRFYVEGTHRGELMGIPPTGRSIRLPGITILRFANGKCVERWSQADFFGLLQQLGALPTPQPPKGASSPNR